MIEKPKSASLWSYLSDFYQLYEDRVLISAIWECGIARASQNLSLMMSVNNNVQKCADYTITGAIGNEGIAVRNMWVDKFFNEGYLGITETSSITYGRDEYETLWYCVRQGFTVGNINSVINTLIYGRDNSRNSTPLVNTNMFKYQSSPNEYRNYITAKARKASWGYFYYTTSAGATINKEIGQYPYFASIRGIKDRDIIKYTQNDIDYYTVVIKVLDSNVIGKVGTYFVTSKSIAFDLSVHVTVYNSLNIPGYYLTDCLIIDETNKRTYVDGGFGISGSDYLLDDTTVNIINQKYVYNGPSGLKADYQNINALSNKTQPPSFSDYTRRGYLADCSVPPYIPNAGKNVYKPYYLNFSYYGEMCTWIPAVESVTTVTSPLAEAQKVDVITIGINKYPINVDFGDDNIDIYTITGLPLGYDIIVGEFINIQMTIAGKQVADRVLVLSGNYVESTDTYTVSVRRYSKKTGTAPFLVIKETFRYAVVGDMDGDVREVRTLENPTNYTCNILLTLARGRQFIPSNLSKSPFYDIPINIPDVMVNDIMGNIRTVMGIMNPLGTKIEYN